MTLILLITGIKINNRYWADHLTSASNLNLYYVNVRQTGFNYSCLKACICAWLNSYKKSGKQAAQRHDEDAKPQSALLKVWNTTDIECANSEVPAASDTDLRII